MCGIGSDGKGMIECLVSVVTGKRDNRGSGIGSEGVMTDIVYHTKAAWIFTKRGSVFEYHREMRMTHDYKR